VLSSRSGLRDATGKQDGIILVGVPDKAMPEREPLGRSSRSDEQRPTRLAATPDYESLRTVLERAVARVCPRSLAAQREDIVQAAVIRVMEVLRKGEQDEIRSSSYLWQVATSVTVDEIRRATRRKEVSLDELAPEGQVSGARLDPEQETAGRELGNEIRDCLTRLIRPRRLAVTLHLYGFRAEEAQRVLGWGVKRIRNLTYRGLADLRRCLEAKGLAP